MENGLEIKIDEGNIGNEMLEKMGYQKGQGLVKDGNGMLFPLPLEKKPDRKALEEANPKVNVADTAATIVENNGEQKKTGSKRSRIRRKKTKEEKAATEAEQQAQMATNQALKAQKAAEKANELAIKAQQIASELKGTPTAEIRNKCVSPQYISTRSPTPTHPPQRPIDIKEELIFSPPKTKVDSLLTNNTSDPKHLKSLLNRFYSEIKLMQMRLETDASFSSQYDDYDVIVAKIRICDDEIIDEHAFEFIRTELVGWIGIYQEQELATPIFHSMCNNIRHITVVCDDAYAYQCLKQCVHEISKVQDMSRIRIYRLPRVTPLIYCFDAVYEGISRDTSLFLHQIRLHKPKLQTKCWVVVSHEVCVKERRTYFIFLIDERSALALTFQYSSKFCICTQTVVFSNRGIVTENHLN